MAPAMTPAQRHLARYKARQAAITAPLGAEPQGSAYELMQAQLIEHRRALKGIQSVERKIEAKRGFLPAYDLWIDEVLEHGRGAQDVVLMTVMVWQIDVGRWQRAVQIAAYALRYKLSLPDQYNRDLATLLIDEFSDAALAGKMVGEAMVVLPRVKQLTDDLDAPDQARAKLFKALAYGLIGRLNDGAEIDYGKLSIAVAQRALENCKRAYQLFAQVGVKKDIERLERRLKATGEPGA